MHLPSPLPLVAKAPVVPVVVVEHVADAVPLARALVEGGLPVHELRELIGSRLPDEGDADYHTAAGMLIAQFGRIPTTGEHIEWAGWRIEVVDLDGPRIDKLLLQKLPEAEPGDG